jgi:predicted TIM-barrel fold metal-dependent hydrolase
MQATMTRRRWLTSAMAAPLAGTLAAPLAWADSDAKTSGVGGIVDAHVHIWTADTKKFPLADGFTAEDMWYPSYSAEEVMKLGRAAGVHRFNLIQMTWYGVDHAYILDVIARNPKQFVGTGVVPAVTDVWLADPGAAMVDLARGGVYAFRVRGKSTRPKFNDSPRWMDHPGYERMFITGAEHNLALSFLMTPADLPELDRMCSRFPQTPVIIDHFCLIGRNHTFIEEEIQQLCRLAQHRRVMLKIGAFYALGAKQPPYLDILPVIRRVVDAFGPQRCMWESDSPQQTKNGHTFAAAVDIIKKRADFLTDSDKHQILVKTAEDFFFER